MNTLATPDDRASLLDHDRRFFDALVAGDAARLSELLADDFILVSVNDGAAVPGSVLLDAVSSGAVRFPAVQSFPDEAVVRRIGDVGIVVGRTGMNFTNPDGSTFTGGSRYTHVFVAGSGTGWRLVSAQGTEIRAGA
ncbi:nuclear transport factor 2 family protein [Streptosporangium sp. NPDC049644]|uniref:YybH family protein n=1 Tax=Streptosporangium sp. NPDC049644 TaxID=3155507 RepID=UPI00341A71F7